MFLDTGGTFSRISVFSGYSVPEVAYGINTAGQIVGAYTTSGSGYIPVYHQHAFLYNGGTISTVDVPGATDTWAHGINTVGQIVGYSTAPGAGVTALAGGTRVVGLVATATGAAAVVPEPASFALVAAGLGVVGAVARRRTRVTA